MKRAIIAATAALALSCGENDLPSHGENPEPAPEPATNSATTPETAKNSATNAEPAICEAINNFQDQLAKLAKITREVTEDGPEGGIIATCEDSLCGTGPTDENGICQPNFLMRAAAYQNTADTAILIGIIKDKTNGAIDKLSIDLQRGLADFNGRPYPAKCLTHKRAEEAAGNYKEVLAALEGENPN